MNKYEKFEDWFNELENFSMRSDRFYEELQTIRTAERIEEWLRSAWFCAREQACSYCTDPDLREVFFDQTCPCCVERMKKFADKIGLVK
jgi:hypothetical protein